MNFKKYILVILLLILVLYLIVCAIFLPPWINTKYCISDVALDKTGAIIFCGNVYKPEISTRSDNVGVFISGSENFMDSRFHQTIGRYSFHGVALDSSGALFVTGTLRELAFFHTVDDTYIFPSSNNSSYDCYVAKYDTLIVPLWGFLFGGSSDDIGVDIKIDDEDNIYVGGNFSNSCDFDPGPDLETRLSVGNQDFFVCKFSADGDFQWVNTGGSNSFTELSEIYLEKSDTMDFIISCGYFEDTLVLSDSISFDSAGGKDCFICKYDSSGTLIWAKAWGGHGNDVALAVIGDIHGNIIVSGSYEELMIFNTDSYSYTHSSNGEDDIFFTIFDKDGNILKAITTGGLGEDVAHDIVVDSSGNMYVAGSYSDVVDFNPSTDVDEFESPDNSDAFITKYNEQWDYEWTVTFPSKDYSNIRTLTLTNNEEIFASGEGLDNGIWVLLSASGELLNEGDSNSKP
jgi:hypothetical protein